jgi:hypothetical protein
MSFATLSGLDILSARVVFPFAGIWHASIVLAGVAPSPGPQVLLIGTASYLCAPVRDITFAGQRGVLVVGGSGGWRTPVPPKQYGQGAVPIQAILIDAAASCGELPPIGATGSVAAYVRKGSPYTASTALQELLGNAWWMGPTGNVQAIPRLPTPIVSLFDAMAVNASSGVYQIATESPQDWVPGCTFLGPTVSGTVSRVTHFIEPGTLRTEVMVTP